MPAAISARLKLRTYPEAAAVVTVSTAIADDLARVCGLDRGLVAVIPNPVAPAEREEAAGFCPNAALFARLRIVAPRRPA